MKTAENEIVITFSSIFAKKIFPRAQDGFPKKLNNCGRPRTRYFPVVEKLATECKSKSMEKTRDNLGFGALSPLQIAGGRGKTHQEEQTCSGNYVSIQNRTVITMEGIASFVCI